jgi:GntR family transcriptional regulator
MNLHTPDLSRSGSQALHEQLSARLRALIEQGEHGTKLPTEEELVRAFDVSRTTVRRAIQTLVTEGILVRRQGMGTFIARPNVVQSLDRLSPFVDAFASVESVETRLLDFRWIAGEEVPDEFAGPSGEALTFRRLYLTDGVPHALVHIRLPDDVGHRISRAQLEEHPIYHVLQNELALKLQRAQITVASEAAEPDVADALEVPSMTPLLVLRRVTFSDDGRPVEVGTHYLLPDVYRLRLTVSGGELAPLIWLPNHKTKPESR